MLPDYDCVVVGAGLVGAAQAIALSHAGFKVLVLDARARLGDQPGDDVRGLALAQSSRALLASLDVWPAIAEDVAPVREIHISDQGHFGSTRLHANDCDLDALGYVCPADSLLRALENALCKVCEVSWRSRVADLETEESIAKVTLNDDAGERVVSTTLLIGADGAYSTVREQLGIAVKMHRYEQHAIVANVQVERIPSATAIERFTRDGPLALLPMRSGRHVAVRCCASATLDDALALSDDQFLSELEAGFGYRFGRFQALGQRNHHELFRASAAQTVGPRSLLVGAAANHIHPNGAQGLNLGLRDVASLVDVLRSAREHGDDFGASNVLERYANARSADRRAVVRFSDTMAQVFASRLPFVPSLRNVALIALDATPPARRWLIRRAAGLLGESPLLRPSVVY